ncbi:glycosyltransferase family 1 protein [Pedobacter sp. KR3-3]|uniref:Glycosyltransferase family 1 protein n=1 Tax=Pedobacter albus TaxID=3113905 RepID=A0ABU7I775_9SPHI|nr:glycosyltransferase family 1 protein [Pedobacter sp. KR3-3]MEE1945146.1 glycosyltransferase family 1 protein [Pedobacter sp. KR3-3]
MQERLLLYFKKPKLTDRWIYGDRYLRRFIKFLSGKKKIGSLERVFLNLCKGLELLGIPYHKNLPFSQIRSNDRIIALGMGPQVLAGYNQPNKIIAGIGLMTHPSNWPTLFKDYPIATYLQHSEWSAAIYNRWYGPNSSKIWPVGIDTAYWQPQNTAAQKTILVYVKFLWDRELNEENLLKPILKFLTQNKIDHRLITYGNYILEEYKEQLTNSKAMIFLCEHESQGLAYQEAMAMDVPIFAWNQGLWLDKNLPAWGETEPVAASAVPYFDETCGDTFKNIEEFERKFPAFYTNVEAHAFQPRKYILDHLTLEKSTARMLEIIKEVYQ